MSHHATLFACFAVALAGASIATVGCSSGTPAQGSSSDGGNNGDGSDNGDGSIAHGDGSDVGDAGGDAKAPIVPGTHFDATATKWTLPATGYDLYQTSGINDSIGDGVWSTLDIDGDGKLDLVVTAAWNGTGQFVLGGVNAPYWNVYRGNGASFSTAATKWTLPATGYDLYQTSGINDSIGDGVWSTLDIDGDGKLDLVVTAAWNGTGQFVLGGVNAPYWNVYRGNGSGFSTTATKWTLPATGYDLYQTSGINDSIGDGVWSTLDIDGDGKLDLVVTAAWNGTGQFVLGGVNAPYWNVYRGNGASFSTAATKWTLPATGYDLYQTSGINDSIGDGVWSTLDIDGDGKLDLVVTAAWNGTGQFVLGGVNAPYWNVYRGNGSGFSTTATKWTLPATGYDLYQTSGINDSIGDGVWSTLDIDGDGKLDLVVTAAWNGTGQFVLGGVNAPYWNVYRGNGASFSTAATKWTLPATGYDLYQTSGINDSIGDGVWTTLDIDGDGRPDLVLTAAWNGAGQFVLGGVNAPYWNAYLNAP